MKDMAEYESGKPAPGGHDQAPAEMLVVIAASAGGLPAMRQVLASLPADFPGAVAIVQHRADHRPDLLPELLDAWTLLQVRSAVHGDVLEAGHIYVCPPGMHMTTRPCIQLAAGPRRRFVRPSADLMLESAARVYGDRAIGIILSGAGSDGALGSRAIVEAGGRVIAQDPSSCDHAGMPTAALAATSAARVPIDQIAHSLTTLVASSQSRKRPRWAESSAWTRARRVLLADDHRIVLDGLAALLRIEPDLEVIGHAESGRAAVDLAAQLSPDVVVMDVAMPDMNGIEATRRIKTSSPHTVVIALSARADDETATRILEAGAMGYVVKEGAFDELAMAIRVVLDRRQYLSPHIAAAIEGRRKNNGRARSGGVLTASEREIVQLTAEGRTTDEIALSMGFSTRFVEGRLKRTMQRLGLDNVASLTRYAIREGLTSVES
jgi:two-component system, NarL family, response regulator NreC